MTGQIMRSMPAQNIPVVQRSLEACTWCWSSLHPGKDFPEAWSSTICQEHSTWMEQQAAQRRARRADEQNRMIEELYRQLAPLAGRLAVIAGPCVDRDNLLHIGIVHALEDLRQGKTQGKTFAIAYLYTGSKFAMLEELHRHKVELYDLDYQAPDLEQQAAQEVPSFSIEQAKAKRRQVLALLASLTDRQRRVVMAAYSINPRDSRRPCYTLESVCRRLHMNTESFRTARYQAVNRLKVVSQGAAQ